MIKELKPNTRYVLRNRNDVGTSDPVRETSMPEGYGQRKVPHVMLYPVMSDGVTLDLTAGEWEPVADITHEIGPLGGSA